jgi:hypothetical protein
MIRDILVPLYLWVYPGQLPQIGVHANLTNERSGRAPSIALRYRADADNQLELVM